MHKCRRTCCRTSHLQAKLADNEAKATKFTERLAHERCKRGTFDKELKAVDAEHSAAQKALEAASRKAEAAAAAMKELEQRDVKVCAHGRYKSMLNWMRCEGSIR